MDTLRYPTLKSWATAVCDAVREKEESAGEIPHQDVPDRIHAIRTRPDEYPGPYTIEPAMEEQVLPTKDKVMTENLVVAAGYKDGGVVLHSTSDSTYYEIYFDVSELDSFSMDVLSSAKAYFIVLRVEEGGGLNPVSGRLMAYSVIQGLDGFAKHSLVVTNQTIDRQLSITYESNNKRIKVKSGTYNVSFGDNYSMVILY